MPSFPAFAGELPRCLSPLNLRHYALLAYWTFFRPTALKCYLYRADPDAYTADRGGNDKLRLMLQVPAYRNLWFMTSVLGSGLVLAIAVVGNAAQGTTVNWTELTLDVAGNAAFAVAGGVALGVALGVAWGVAFGVAGGVALGVALGVAGGVAGGVAVGVALGVAVGVAWGVAGGVAEGAAFGVAWGVAGGVAAGAAFGVAGGVAEGAAFGVAFGMAIILGAIRFPFYLFTLGAAFGAAASVKIRSPINWDELIVLPVAFFPQTLARRLVDSMDDALPEIVAVTRNPFQRWVAQRSLHECLHTTAAPLQFLFSLTMNASLKEYVTAPLGVRQWRDFPCLQPLLLAEIDGRWFDSSGGMWRTGERLVWFLTRRLRARRQTSLTRLAGMLCDLYDETRVESVAFDLGRYQDVFQAVAGFPGGEEVSLSYQAMMACDSCRGLEHIAEQARLMRPLGAVTEPIRPAVLEVLGRLGDVAAEAGTFQAATSRVNKLAALGRATGQLDALDDYVANTVPIPERYVLRRIVRQWRRLVGEASGRAGAMVARGPIANPYVLSNPVRGRLFVGREDILRRLEELWSGDGSKPSVVLWGHRRMGKSSILANLGEGQRFGIRTTVVDFNMQRVGQVHSTGELLYNLALSLHDAQASEVLARSEVSAEPEETAFTNHNPYTAFDRFMQQMNRVRGDRCFVVTVDEFESIERAISEGQLEPQLLEFWRGLIQTYPWFVMAFAGLHTLKEMTEDYWHPLFGSVTAIPVSFLRPAAARDLITNPADDFPLDYDPDALDRIITLTHGQPFLIQLICHGLVSRFNRQAFEEEVDRERRFNLDDVDAVVDAPELFDDGDAYFKGVWEQAKGDKTPGQIAVLRALAESPEGLPLMAIARQASLTPGEATRAMDVLGQHDVVTQAGDHWRLTVELMRRWVARSQPKAPASPDA